MKRPPNKIWRAFREIASCSKRARWRAVEPTPSWREPALAADWWRLSRVRRARRTSRTPASRARPRSRPRTASRRTAHHRPGQTTRQHRFSSRSRFLVQQRTLSEAQTALFGSARSRSSLRARLHGRRVRRLSTAVYGAPPSSLAAASSGFATLKGSLPFPLAGRSEIRLGAAQRLGTRAHDARA